ncbi:MAG: cation transporter [Acidisphaera sp.]|nr:cation transporter [Acidisphaera sp.]
MTGPHHGHGGHGHTHAPASFGVAFAVGTVLNAGFVVIEAICGVLAHSMALIADAGHNLGDVLGLLMAWAAAVLARRNPTPRYTYGLGRGTILAALLNAGLLLMAVGAIAVEAVRRLLHPAPIGTLTVMVIAAIGIAVNGGTALLFAAGRRGDLNLRTTFLHMAGDALISIGVVATAAAILLTGWLRLDPLVSLAIAGAILAGTWSTLREAFDLSMDAVPPGISAEAVRAYFAGLPGVARTHDLHIWPMSTTRTALTVHLVMPGRHPGDRFIAEVCHELGDRFGIGHATLQIELDEGVVCALEPDHVI